ncbi:MAG: diguanylate cyclase and metal dependent phosphohydrolase, partial [uncultured bacterium (gcode 4)]
MFCEALNKIILNKTMNEENKPLLCKIVLILSEKISFIIDRLEEIKYDNKKINNLLFILWKLKVNFSHVIYENVSEIYNEIKTWLKIQKKSNFWNNPSLWEKYQLIWRWNLAIARINSLDENSTKNKKSKEKWIKKFIDIYNFWKEEKVKSSEELINDFMSSSGINEFQIEWICNIVKYDDIDTVLLIKLANFLIKNNVVYENFYYENYKIITIIIAINKISETLILRNVKDLHLPKNIKDTISNIINYIEFNNNTSHLIFDYSKIYISAALLYSNYDDHKKESMVYFNKFLTINWENISLYKKEAEQFYQNLWPQWKTRFQDNRELLNLKNENAVMVAIQDLIESTVDNLDKNYTFQDINKGFCDIICKLIFNDLCSAEISKDCEKCTNNKKCVECSKNFERWWYKKKKINLKWWYRLIFKYPVTLSPITGKNVFEEIFDRENNFIKQRLWSLLNIYLNNEALKKSEETTTKMTIGWLRTFDNHTWCHSENVSRYSVWIWKWLGYSESQLSLIKKCWSYHDIWKKNVNQEYITRPGWLTQEEFREVSLHTYYWLNEIIKEEYSRELLDAMYHHCYFFSKKRWLDITLTPKVIQKKIENGENFDPSIVNKVCGLNIPEISTITAIWDVADAIAWRRLYDHRRVWWPIENIIREIDSELILSSWLKISAEWKTELDYERWKEADGSELSLPYCIEYNWKMYVPKDFKVIEK